MLPGRLGSVTASTSARPATAPTGIPPPITLPSMVRSGRTPRRLLPAAVPEPEGHDLVEDEQRAGPARVLAQPGEEVVLDGDDPARAQHRFEEDGGERARLVERPLGAGDVVHGEGDGAGRVRCLPHQRLVRAVVGVLGERQPRASREAARDARRDHPGLGPRVGEAHPLRRGQSVDDTPRQFALLPHRGAEQEVAAECRPDRFKDERGLVPVHEGRVVAEAVDQDVAVDVDQLDTVGLSPSREGRGGTRSSSACPRRAATPPSRPSPRAIPDGVRRTQSPPPAAAAAHSTCASSAS